MDCQQCKVLISAFLESRLEAAEAADIRMHLALCEDCGQICEETASMLDLVPIEMVPPNSQALWCRINNIIETEILPNDQPAPPTEVPRGRFWRLSLAQLSAAVLMIAVGSSLITIVALRSYSEQSSDIVLASSSERSFIDKVLGRIGLTETPQEIRERRMRQQQAAIDYWNARVQSRRLQWDRNTREAFDRNLQVIDQSVSEYSTILQRDPEDELSGEMLDSVLDDKMNLLRDFADL